MRLEMEMHGADVLTFEKMTFSELAEKYETEKFSAPRFENGIKSGRRSVGPSKSAIKPLKDFFGKHSSAHNQSDGDRKV